MSSVKFEMQQIRRKMLRLRPPCFQKLHHAEVNRKSVGAVETSTIGSQQVIEARVFGMFRQSGEYLGCQVVQ
jgi:hypothetical protein